MIFSDDFNRNTVENGQIWQFNNEANLFLHFSTGVVYVSESVKNTAVGGAPCGFR